MKRIGIISDTHGTFDDTLREFLKDVDEIWHAGDIGSIELADRIAAFKPLRAVSGNIDGGMTRRVYPAFQAFECERVQVLMTHIGGYPRHYDPRAVQKIQSVHPKLFIAGHSHILKVIYDPVYEMCIRDSFWYWHGPALRCCPAACSGRKTSSSRPGIPRCC